MAVLILAKHDNATLNDATAKTVTAAKALGGDSPSSSPARTPAPSPRPPRSSTAWPRSSTPRVPAYGHRLAEPLTDLVVSMAAPYSHIVFPATTSGKNVAPRVAALLDVMVISDVTGVVAPDTFERPIYAGNALQTVQSSDAKKVITVRTAALRRHRRAGRRPDRDRRRPRRRRPVVVDRGQGRDLRPARAHLGQDRGLGRPRHRLGGELPHHRVPRRQARRRGRRLAAPRSTRASRRTTGRSARPARSSRPSSTSPSASPARSSTSPG